MWKILSFNFCIISNSFCFSFSLSLLFIYYLFSNTIIHNFCSCSTALKYSVSSYIFPLCFSIWKLCIDISSKSLISPLNYVYFSTEPIRDILYFCYWYMFLEFNFNFFLKIFYFLYILSYIFSC